MLQLQRASAGSGKTFTLTKIYIRNFIAKKINGNYRLRTESEMRAAHGRILAITFTNKATNEMKQRIVSSLADLAGLTDKEDSKIDYLADFQEEFKATKEEIKKASLIGLTILLHTYSDFQVSTIDSFFQTILRTLAVETDRNESYQIELDDKYLSQVGVDMTLSEINDPKSKSNSKIWIQSLILDMLRSEGESWNPFQHSSSGLYGKMVEFTKLFHSEEFKDKVEGPLMEYFGDENDFLNVYRELKKKQFECYEQNKKAYYDNVAELAELLQTQNLSLQDLSKAYNKLWTMDNIKNKKMGSLSFGLGVTILNLGNEDEDKVLTDKLLVEKLRGVADILCRQKDLILKWEILDRYWQANNKKLYYLGLIQSIKANIKKYREENNIIPLSETNRILKGIINEDDAPFIYERIGTYINHYLIDEFQDTSRLQWYNLSPLVEESLSHEDDYDNLIIGDVKQSIYRFRNAEPMLIQEDVPQQFECVFKGINVEENTNWRSSREIVKFNNSFFSQLAHILNKERKESKEDRQSINIVDLYNNAIQKIKNTNKAGYVEINLLPTKGGKPYKWLGDLIHKLLNKGYKQKDIAFLVNKSKHGEELIKELLEYNQKEENRDKTPIAIISEESLKIAESRAVKLIIAVMEMIVNGRNIASENKFRDKYRSVEINDFMCHYNYYHTAHPEMTTTEIVEYYFSQNSDMMSISQMLKQSSIVALPALVENIIKNFVPEELCKSDVAFMAAFQDKVLEYCQLYPTDVASFLTWWKDTGADKATISSPENTDAVQIMTIHKSKGLEFKCVILPYADWTFSVPAGLSPTIWVEPKFPEGVQIDGMPPFLPIEVSNRLKDTLYENEYQNELDKIIIDQLNKTYVAFTRAVDELYIFAPHAQKGGRSIGDYMKRVVPTLSGRTFSADPEGKYTLGSDEVFSEEICKNTCYRIGEVTPKDVELSYEKSDSNKKKQVVAEEIEKYHINTSIKLLKAEDASQENEDQIDAKTAFESEQIRKKGKLMHSIMEQIITLDDVPSAVRKMRLSGKINSKEAEQIESLLKERISRPQVERWFDKDAKVYVERTLLCSDKKDRRPDRIIFFPNGDVEVVDYKFGDQLNDSLYSAQVCRYIHLLKSIKLADGQTPKFRSVKGFIWYVSLDIVKEVLPAYKDVN